MKGYLYGDETEPKKENVDKVCETVLQSRENVLVLLLQYMRRIDFEVRQRIAHFGAAHPRSPSCRDFLCCGGRPARTSSRCSSSCCGTRCGRRRRSSTWRGTTRRSSPCSFAGPSRGRTLRPTRTLTAGNRYENPEVSLNCGMILRECIRHEPLAEMALNDPAVLDPLFNYVQLSTFDVASDAFQTFKVEARLVRSLCG
jgi:hypothetical protein